MWWWPTCTRRARQKIAERIDGLAVTCNVGDPVAVADLVARAEAAFGSVHVFCSNAGIGDRSPDLESTAAQVREIVDVNLLAHVWAAQQVVPGMVERGEGYIVQTISSAALITGPSGMGYTLTKHGALGFAEWLALNYAHRGIVVTCLCPNAVNTGMLGRNEDDEQRSGRIDSPVITNIGDVVEPEVCADMTVDAMRERRFLVLPHPRVGESFARQGGRLRPLARGNEPPTSADARRGRVVRQSRRNYTRRPDADPSATTR